MPKYKLGIGGPTPVMLHYKLQSQLDKLKHEEISLLIVQNGVCVY
jgi:hypothetical protein